MVSKRVVGELGEQAVVLMEILTVVREDEVRLRLLPETVEPLLDLGRDVREVAAPKRLDLYACTGAARKEGVRRDARLRSAFLVRAEDDPVHVQGRIRLEQPQQRPAAADLDVVAVRPDAQDAVDPTEGKDDHAVRDGSAQTRQGPLPASSIPSSCCLSFSVSMGAQKPS
jgi:hypothetical protein